jgi:hypothetical protein
MKPIRNPYLVTPKPMPPFQTTRTVSSKNGFALVVTLSLMILLTIIAVGLLSLASVTLRSSSVGDAGAIARANARLSLMLAIGELQKEMGPDSRISAAHDAGTESKGGQPHWTAVYDAWKAPEDPTTPETPQTRTLKFRSWLVSNATSSTAEKIPLVGSASLKEKSLPQDQIQAPMLAVKIGKQQGRFAWWVSDESVKAKINAGLENSDDKDKPIPASPLVDAQSPPNVGHKAVTELAKLDWKPGQRSAAITNGVVNLTASLEETGIGGMNHDITVHSAGVLSDVRTGRLKRDLSNLLSRPVTELQDKPLYLANGRMNRFQISENGAVTNTDGLPANAAGADRWGINLEELHLFHQLHREIDWNTGKPQLVNKNTKEAMLQDRFFLYRKPIMEAQNVMLSFKAEPDTTAGAQPNTYRIVAMMDAMVVTSNPNDIPIVWPAGVLLRMEMEGFPYRPKWNIRRANGSVKHSHTVTPINKPFFQSAIRTGFTLEPGEAAVFGASSTDTKSRGVNLTRGYKPRGGVLIEETEWGPSSNPANDGLRANGLLATDTMDFTMIPAPTNNGATPSGWISCTAEIRNASGGTDTGISMHRLAGGGGSLLTDAPISRYMPSSIRPPQRLNISQFIGNPLAVLMVTTMPNVEKSRIDLQPPNAFASRPYQLHEPAINNMIVSTTTPANTDLTMQNSQLVTIAESMEYEFVNRRSMAIGEIGKERIYQGGGREVETGGAFMAVKRRIPLAPPLSLGAFENAIACGMTGRFASSGAFNGNANGLPAMAKSIGNSWANPFLNSNSVSDGAYHDPSWMSNTALWDSWFLSGVTDVRSSGSSAYLKDDRSPREQFKDLAEGTGTLRNRRLAYNPRESVQSALDELFDSETLKPSAINKLPKYLLLDGAFNVNSTSLTAWKAFLTSVRDQELLVPSGPAQKKNLPFGTLGYAAYDKNTIGYSEDWNGFKDLSDSEMETLASNIVVEVKERGPFLSMSDFVNRRPNSSNELHRALGALQAAIDKSGLNLRYTEAERILLANDIPALAGKDTLNHEKVPARAIGSAGYLSQAALLSAFGSQIATRGDTFVIRTYGDARDASGKVLAKAWCEAVVQRFPEYVDTTNAADTSEELTTANSTFGRKFDIVSFRWLNPEEI